MSDLIGTFPIEPNPVSFGFVPQKDINVRVVRLTNRLGEPIRISIAGKSVMDVPQGQPPSGFFWPSLEAEIPFSGSHEFPVEFRPRAEGRFEGKIEIHIAPHGIVDGDLAEIRLAGIGLPPEFEPL